MGSYSHNNHCAINVYENDKIINVKERVSEILRYNINNSEYILYFNSRELMNESTIKDNNISKGVTLLVSRKLRG